VKFSVVAETFALIEPESSRLEMTRMLAELLGKATPSEAGIICYLSLGQLNAQYIGTQFNIAEKNAIKAVAELLHQDVAEITREVKKIGDVGTVVSEGSWHVREDLTIHQVHAALEKIAAISGEGSHEKKISALVALLEDVDQISAKYIVRIVLDKLRLGFSDMTIVDALSWMEVGDKSLRSSIENAYNICADIGLIAQTLKADGIEAIEKMHIHVGVPIRSAAAERLPTAKAIIEKMGHCIAQPKIDGFRLQIHMDKTKKPTFLKFFSRNLQNMSNMFPDLAQAFETLDVETIICEGEAIAYDPDSQSFLPFQETVRRKRKHGVTQAAEELPLQTFLFDLLYLNGKDMMKEPYETRRDALLKIVKHGASDRIHVIEEKHMETVKDLEDYFNENISSGLEGVVVKRPYSQYTPGKRNFNWIKLKRQEEGHLEDTIDCVILGYYAGSGKRAHFGVGAFLVGVYNKAEDRFETIAKIGTGMKDADWIDLKKRCEAIKVKEKPKNVVCPKELYPDVWVMPKIVCLVRADEITLSPTHTAAKTEKNLGYALRFPRFMGYRPDKSAFEATTVDEIKHLFKDQLSR